LDPKLNDYWARALVTGNWTPPPHSDDPEIRTTPYGRPPAYPYMLAGIYRVFGLHYLAPRIAQMVVGLVNLILIFLISRRCFGSVSGVIAAAALAFYWPVVYFDQELNDPVFEITLVLILTWLVLRWHDGPAAGWMALAGVTLGLFALFRPNALLLLPALLAWLVYLATVKRAAWRSVSAAMLVAVAGCVAVVSPAIVRNYVVGREFILISSYGGINAYLGNHDGATGDKATIANLQELAGVDGWDCFSYPALVRGLAAKLGRDRIGFGEASHHFYTLAADFIARKPADALRLTLRKALLFWGPQEVSDSAEVELERDHSNVLAALPGFAALLSYALLGAVLLARHRRTVPARTRDAAVWMLLFVGAYFLSVLPFFIAGRYRIPIVPALALLTGYALATLLDWARSGQLGRVAAGVAFATFSCIVVSVSWAPYAPDEAKWHLNHGMAHMDRDETRAALQDFERAVEKAPERVEPRLWLAFALAASNQRTAAVHQYMQVLSIQPNHLLANNNLGYEFYRAQRYDAAEQYLKAAVKVNPRYARAWCNLGLVYRDQGRKDAAAAAFDQALKWGPAAARAHE
jgi:tetratricopeptide (TPR) repeat protein